MESQGQKILAALSVKECLYGLLTTLIAECEYNMFVVVLLFDNNYNLILYQIIRFYKIVHTAFVI